MRTEKLNYVCLKRLWEKETKQIGKEANSAAC